MKQTYELTPQPVFAELISWVARKEVAQAHLGNLKEFIARRAARLPNRRQLLLTGAATLFLSGLFLAGSYLFFSQLATYGW